jgi:transposase
MRAEGSEQATEIKRLNRELARVTEERNILKKATAYFARESPLSWFADKPLPGSE